MLYLESKNIKNDSKILYLTVVSLILFALGYMNPAFSWVTSGPDWAGDDTTMDVWLQADSWNNSAEDALYRWNNIGASSFDFYIDIDNNNHCSRLCTSANAVEWENFSDGICSDAASGALAICRTNWIIDYCNADVLFNNQYTWTTGSRPWTTGAPYELNTVAIHEFGHALGLSHENRWVATMNCIYHANYQLIHGDDRAGCRHIYPSGSQTDISLTNWTKNDNSCATAARLVNGPTSATAGQVVSTEWVLDNLGTTGVTYDVRWYLSTNSTITTSDTVLSTNSGAWISGPGSLTFTKNLTIPASTSPGTYWIGLIVDYNNLVAESNEGNNALAQPRSVTISCPSQGAPSGVNATDGTYTDKVQISWNSVSGATQYLVYRNTTSSSAGASTISSWQSSTSFNDTTATPEVTYYYWVKARNGCGNISGFSSYNTGWRAMADSCKAPPLYDFTLTPTIDWKTTSTSFGMEGCRVYRIYMYAGIGYDFSVCSIDGVGGSCNPGDGDFRLFNDAGTQQWYIDGDSGCSYDATTLGTGYEGWAPPTEGYYYLRVEDYYDGAATYTLAYRLSGEHCYSPPTYDYTITPFSNWQTTGEEFFAPSGCRVYRMYLYAHNKYDFSVCGDDGVGGICDPGDGDFRMYDSAGDQQWYIDGFNACGFDASTLGTVYEGWSPPSDGHYYLEISDYYGDRPATYTLAYKYCPILFEPIEPDPMDGETDVSRYTDLSWVRGARCDILDDFNRSNSTNMGPYWTEQAGDFSITSQVATSTNTSLMTYNKSIGEHLCVDVIHNGISSVQYVALVSGYADLNNNVFVKIQNNVATGTYDRVYFYFGNNGSNNIAWNNTGSETISAAFSSARMTTHLVGDTITVEFDTDFDGIPDQTYARDGINTTLIGSKAGLGGYGNPLMDNFGVASASAASAQYMVATGLEATSINVMEESDVTMNSATSQSESLTEADVLIALSQLPAGRCCSDIDAEQTAIVAPAVPPGFVMQGGTLVESNGAVELPPAVLAPTNLMTALAPGTMLIDFDDIEVTGSFSQEVRLTNRYAALGVIFAGPGGNDGGAILNESGSFGVTGHSSPNFLAFNPSATMNDGGTPQSPETIYFSTPVNFVQVLTGSGAFGGGTVTLSAYDVDNTLVDNASVALASAVTPISVTGVAIVRVVITNSSSSYFIIDDLQFTYANLECLDLGHPSVSPYFSTGAGGERSVAVDMNNTVSVSSLEIRVEIKIPTDLTVTIREVDGTTRGAVLDSATVPVLPGGPTWYAVPIEFTFESERRYDIGFNVTGDWNTDHEMEFYLFNNSSLNPASGFDVGPFKVLDGGEWDGGSYSNAVMPHIRACACAVTYDVYFGSSYPPTNLIYEALHEPIVDPTPVPGSKLNSCTAYYWRVIARSCCDEIAGPIWTFKTELVGDLDGNGQVNLYDFAIFSAHYLDVGCTDPFWCGEADLSHGGIVNVYDFSLLIDHWLGTCPGY